MRAATAAAVRAVGDAFAAQIPVQHFNPLCVCVRFARLSVCVEYVAEGTHSHSHRAHNNNVCERSDANTFASNLESSASACAFAFASRAPY